MRALRVGSVRQVLCASPGYLQERGIPDKPRALQTHQLVASSAGGFTPGWRFLEGGQARTLGIRPRLSVTTNDAAIEAAVGGLGITRLLSYQVAPQLAAGELQIILHEYETPALPVHILHREGPGGSARVRAFIDLLARQLRSEPALN